MTRRRSNPPAPGQYCDATMTRYGGQCNDPAVYIVRWIDEDTGEEKHDNACGGHTNRIMEMRRSRAEFSREQFRCIFWEDAIAYSKAKREAEAAAKAEEAV